MVYKIIIISLLVSTYSCSGQQKTTDSSDKSISTSPITMPIERAIDTIGINKMQDGLKHGLWRSYFDNGQLKSEGSYRLGDKEGLHREWAEDGIPVLEGFYEKGLANGLMKWFDPKGNIAGSGNMVDEIREGRWTICDVEGTGFCIDANFKAGKRDGIWKIPHEDAQDKVWKIQTWRDDRIVSEACVDLEGNAITCN